MIRVARAVAGALATLTVLAGIGWVSRAPYDAPGAESAILRLSWRMPGASAQICRDRTQAELDALPVHMRTPQVCETQLTTYRLETRIDDGPVLSRRLRPAGARGDRPLAVWQETRLAPGRHRVAIRLAREGDADAGDDDDDTDDDEDDDDDDDDDDDRDDAAAAGRLELATDVDATAGAILLVTLDDDGRLFVR